MLSCGLERRRICRTTQVLVLVWLPRAKSSSYVSGRGGKRVERRALPLTDVTECFTEDLTEKGLGLWEPHTERRRKGVESSAVAMLPVGRRRRLQQPQAQKRRGKRTVGSGV